jgi:hypothetical protein
MSFAKDLSYENPSSVETFIVAKTTHFFPPFTTVTEPFFIIGFVPERGAA